MADKHIEEYKRQIKRKMEMAAMEQLKRQEYSNIFLNDKDYQNYMQSMDHVMTNPKTTQKAVEKTESVDPFARIKNVYFGEEGKASDGEVMRNEAQVGISEQTFKVTTSSGVTWSHSLYDDNIVFGGTEIKTKPYPSLDNINDRLNNSLRNGADEKGFKKIDPARKTTDEEIQFMDSIKYIE